jgi:hypothetical protein
VQIGDRVSIIPTTFGVGIDKPGDNSTHTIKSLRKNIKPQAGTVTFISSRWYQVTFDCGVKECFFFDVRPTPLIKDKAQHYRKSGGAI